MGVVAETNDPAPDRGRRRHDRNDLGGTPILLGRILFGFFAFLLYLIVQLWWSLGFTWGPATSALIAVVALVLHLVLVGRRIGSMDPAIWLPVSLLMFYFGVPISMEVLFAHPPLQGYDNWETGLSPSLERGYALALLTMVSFIWGTYIAGYRNLSLGPDPNVPPDHSIVRPAYLLTFGGLLMVAFGIVLVGGPSVVFGLYGDWWAAKGAGADARFIDVGIILTGAGTFALIASADRGHPLRLYSGLAVVLILAVINVQKGSRAALVAVLMGAGWCYTQRVRRVRWGPVLIAAFALIIALPVLKEWRRSRTVEESAQTSARDLMASGVYAMGGTVTVFGYALDYIPRDKSFAYGATFSRAFLQAIPNLGLTPGKSWGSTTVAEHPAIWITCKLTPVWCEQGGGLGFAMGAEFYFNFGITGVLLGVAFWGYVAGRIRNAAGLSAFKLVASALFLGNTAIWVRNVLAAPLKAFLWPLVALLILRGLVSLLFPPHTRQRGSERNEDDLARLNSSDEFPRFR